MEEIPVKKELVLIDGRHFIIEGVPYLRVKPMLEKLHAGISKEKQNRMAMRAVPNRGKLVALDGMKPKMGLPRRRGGGHRSERPSLRAVGAGIGRWSRPCGGA